MQKIKELLGLPAINLSTGEQIGEVIDVVIDAANYRLVGVLLRHKSWFHAGQGILYADMSIGPDAITVADQSAVINAAALAAQRQILTCEDMIGKQLVTPEGELMGTLSDIYLDPATGLLTAYEVSDSVIKDLLEGRSTMPLPAAQRIAEEAVIVELDARQEQPVEIKTRE